PPLGQTLLAAALPEKTRDVDTVPAATVPDLALVRDLAESSARPAPALPMVRADSSAAGAAPAETSPAAPAAADDRAVEVAVAEPHGSIDAAEALAASAAVVPGRAGTDTVLAGASLDRVLARDLEEPSVPVEGAVQVAHGDNEAIGAAPDAPLARS